MMWEPEINDAAGRYGLSPKLVAAFVQVESGGNPWAWNPEPHYRWFWDVRRNQPFRQLLPGDSENESPPLDFQCLAGDRDQEWWGQQASWGLMQTMGAVARENGFATCYLTELCVPKVSLEFGCRHLRRLIARHNSVDSAIVAYNTGGTAHQPGSDGDVYLRKIRALCPA